MKAYTVVEYLQKNKNVIKKMGLHKDMSILEIRNRFRHDYKRGLTSLFCFINEIELSDEDVIMIANALKNTVLK